MTFMDTKWVAPGEGCTLTELVIAAYHIELQSLVTDVSASFWAHGTELRGLREQVEARLINLKDTRCELAIGNVIGTADHIDARRVKETLRRTILRMEEGDV